MDRAHTKSAQSPQFQQFSASFAKGVVARADHDQRIFPASGFEERIREAEFEDVNRVYVDVMVSWANIKGCSFAPTSGNL